LRKLGMISFVLSRVLRVILAVVAVLLVLSLIAVALVFMLALMLWSLLRGRKPVLDFSGIARARAFGAGVRSAARSRSGVQDVVDVEAHEVPESAVNPGAQRLE